MGHHPQPTDPIFPNDDGETHRPRDADNVRDDLALAGCPTTYGTESMTFKDATRHSFATWLGAAGVPDEVIGRLEGHSARTVTRRHYIGDDLARLRDAIELNKLDLSTGEVVALPLAAVGGAPQRYSDTAVFTAGRGKPAVNRGSERGAKLAKVEVSGGVAEWSKAAVLKTAVLARVPGVRIPSPPP